MGQVLKWNIVNIAAVRQQFLLNLNMIFQDLALLFALLFAWPYCLHCL